MNKYIDIISIEKEAHNRQVLVIRMYKHKSSSCWKLFTIEFYSLLLELSMDHFLQLKYNETEIDTFWIKVWHEYPNLHQQAILILLLFVITYLCESAFSCLISIKTNAGLDCKSWRKNWECACQESIKCLICSWITWVWHKNRSELIQVQCYSNTSTHTSAGTRALGCQYAVN